MLPAPVMLGVLVGALYLLACVLPAASGAGSGCTAPRLEPSTRGFFLLLFGWATPAWWANAILAAGAILLNQQLWLLAAVFGCSAFVLALWTWRLVPPLGTEILKLHAGYYLWQSSMPVLVLVSSLADSLQIPQRFSVMVPVPVVRVVHLLVSDRIRTGPECVRFTFQESTNCWQVNACIFHSGLYDARK